MFKNDFSIDHCKLLEVADTMETLVENSVKIELCTKEGFRTYIDPSQYTDCLQQKLPITVILNQSSEKIQISHKGQFNYRDIKTFKDEAGMFINQIGTFNTTMFKHTFLIDECDHSHIEVKLVPQMEG